MLRERITTGYGSLWSHIKHHQTISCNSTSCDKVFPEAPGCSYSGWHAPTNPAQINISGCVVREERTTRTRNPLHCIIRHECWITSYTHAQWKATVIKGEGTSDISSRHGQSSSAWCISLHETSQTLSVWTPQSVKPVTLETDAHVWWMDFKSKNKNQKRFK